MPNIHNLGDSQPQNFFNQFRNSEKEKFSNFRAHEQACVFSLSNSSNIKRNCCFFCCWIRAADKENIRLATKEKKPQYWEGSDWPNLKEKRRVNELLQKYKEWGSRTGKKIGKKYYVRVDIDLLGLPETLRKNLERGFLIMLKREGIVFIKTKKGYHVILLLDELPINGSIYNVDKYGVKRKIGDILSAGRQAQDIGSPEKIQPTEKGKWFWQATSIQEVSRVWRKFFFDFEYREREKLTLTKKNFYGLVVINNQKNRSEKVFINLAKIIRKELFKPWIKRTKPIYKIWYQQNNKSQRYFLLDTYQKNKELSLGQLPLGSINNFVLNQGETYQFYLASC